MQLEQFNPTFRNVLFREAREEVTKGGIFIPTIDFTVKTHADLFDNEKEHKADKQIGDYVVIKAGKDCVEIQVDDVIFLTEGARTKRINLDGFDYFLVMEQQIDGYLRN